MSDGWDLDRDGELSSEAETSLYADHREMERRLREFAHDRGMTPEEMDAIFPFFWKDGARVRHPHKVCRADYVPGSCPCPEGWCIPKMIADPFEDELAAVEEALSNLRQLQTEASQRAHRDAESRRKRYMKGREED